jgi:hypothetical protein
VISLLWMASMKVLFFILTLLENIFHKWIPRKIFSNLDPYRVPSLLAGYVDSRAPCTLAPLWSTWTVLCHRGIGHQRLWHPYITVGRQGFIAHKGNSAEGNLEGRQ